MRSKEVFWYRQKYYTLSFLISYDISLLVSYTLSPLGRQDTKGLIFFVIEKQDITHFGGPNEEETR